MSVLKNKKILLAVTGGIAAYKTTFLVRDFIKLGAEVKVIMTEKATDFVTPLTLSTLSKNPVHFELNDTDGNWTNHVELGIWADIMLVAPATANTIAKMANGMSDNFVMTSFLSAKCPVYIAPAMDLDMYKNKATQDNLKKLIENSIKIIPTESGELASGLVGEGRMAEPENIIEFIINDIKSTLTLSNKKILITAGPTYESIDPVRFIGNHSSGKMGFEIAKEAEKRGAFVTLISGPTNEILDKSAITLISVTSTEEMYNEVINYYSNSDIVIMSAAVADYKPKFYSEIKIKKEVGEMSIELEKTIDILSYLGQNKTHQFLVGFALETNNEEDNALLKLEKKNLDVIVLNSLNDKGAGFKSDTNKVKLISKNKEIKEYSLKNKAEVAKDILDFLEEKI